MSISNEPSPSPQPVARVAIQLVEICAPKSRLQFCISIVCLIALILGLGGAIFAIVLLELEVLRSMLVFIGIVVPTALPSWLESKSRERRVRNAIRSADDDPARLGADLGRGLQPPQLIPLAARELVKRGHRGLVVRICTAAAPAPVVPITVPFEPCSINDLTYRIEEAQPRRNEPQQKRFQRVFVAIGIVGWLFMLTGLPALGYFLGGQPIEKAIALPLVLIAGFGLLWCLQLAMPYRLLVPSGFVEVRPRVFSHAAQLRQFFARDSVLILIGNDKDGWSWTIANETGELRGPNLNNAERMAAILSAWFSPLLPPTPKMLASLRGG